MGKSSSILVIACGALAREITEMQRLNNWTHLTVQCLPADLHNTPKRIPEEVRKKIQEGQSQFDRIFVAYADCGTGGRLDALLEESGVKRLEGAHCYQFYAGTKSFQEMQEKEPGTFFLTDFLVRNFERLVIRGLGLDNYPQLLHEYFGNYRKLIYLSQSNLPELVIQAKQAAVRLGLEFEHVHTGFGGLESGLSVAMTHVVRQEEV